MTQQEWDSMWKSLDEIHDYCKDECRDPELAHVINQLMEKLPGDYCEWLVLTRQEFYKERNTTWKIMEHEIKEKEHNP